jgi:hypothetical protein
MGMLEMFFRRVSSPVMADFGDPIAERRKKMALRVTLFRFG